MGFEDDLAKVKKFYETDYVMSTWEDALISFHLLDWHQPLNVWELGSGNGAWALLMDSLVYRDYQPEFHLVEDFSWSQDHRANNQKWPKNPNELDQSIQYSTKQRSTRDLKYTHYLSTNSLPQNLDSKIDLLRFDCDVDDFEMVFDWIFRNASEEFILLVDDIVPNVSLNRLLATQEQVRKGKLKMLWIGHDHGAWCSPQMNPDSIFQKLLGAKSLFKQLYIDSSLQFADHQHEYLVSRNIYRTY